MIGFRLLSILYLTCLTQLLFAQSLDSLQILLNKTSDETDRIPLLKQMGEGYQAKRDAKAIAYFDELLEIAKKNRDNLLGAYACNRVGVSWLQQNDIQKSSDFYFKGLEMTLDVADFDELRARLNNNLAWNFNLMDDPTRALKYYKDAARYARKIDNAQILGLILNNEALVLKDLKKYDSALIMFEESMDLNEKAGNQRQVRFNLNNIGTVLLAQKKTEQAKTVYENALTLNTRFKDTVEIINNLLNLGAVNTALRQFEKADEQLKGALTLSISSHSLDQQSRVYAALRDLSRATHHDREACDYYLKYQRINDSLYRREQLEKTVEAEAKFVDMVRDRDLQKARTDITEQRLYLGFIVGALFITLVIIFFLWRLVREKRASEKMLMDLNREIEAQAQALQLANEKINLINNNLEEAVKNRTAIIRAQNERLLEFSSMNSHKIRAPLATLLGLLNLFEDGPSPAEDKELITHMKTTAVKMDEIIHEVSRQLEKEDKSFFEGRSVE